MEKIKESDWIAFLESEMRGLSSDFKTMFGIQLGLIAIIFVAIEFFHKHWISYMMYVDIISYFSLAIFIVIGIIAVYQSRIYRKAYNIRDLLYNIMAGQTQNLQSIEKGFKDIDKVFNKVLSLKNNSNSSVEE